MVQIWIIGLDRSSNLAAYTAPNTTELHYGLVPYASEHERYRRVAAYCAQRLVRAAFRQRALARAKAGA
jgi:hypothetical protein